MKLSFLLSCLIVLLMPMQVFAAGDAEEGRVKAATCAACHGQNGNSENPLWPKLAGQHAYYIEKELHDFQNEKRTDPSMSAMAMGLSDIDIENVAAFFASQPVTIEAAGESKVALGEKLYRGGNADSAVPACMACHGPTGAGNSPARFPQVGGQHAAYLAKALNDFKAGSRSNDKQDMMRDIAGRMTAEEIEAVASYMSGLH